MDRSRRRLLVFALLIAAGFLALAGVSWWQGRDDVRAGSVRIAEAAPLEIRRVPRTYRAVYRVENRSGGEKVVNTERVWVRRPFASRIETYRGSEPGGERLSIRQSAFGVLVSHGGAAEPLNIAAPPSLATGDVRFDLVLDRALEEKAILRRERRKVYGRPCQVYRAGGPVFAGDLERYVPRTGSYADVCVDANGLIAEELWILDGRPVQRRVAVEVEVDPALDDDLFAIGVEEKEGFQRGSVVRLLPEQTEGEPLFVLSSAPEGFERLGRYAVEISPAALPAAGQTPGPGPSSLTDVYVRGADLLVVDQGPGLERVVRRDERRGLEIEVDGLEGAELILDARMSEIRGHTPDGSVVRLFGTLRPDELEDVARRLAAPE